MPPIRTRPHIEKISLVTKDVEVPIELPRGTVKYMLQLRSLNANLRLAFKTGQVDDVSNGEYWSLGQGEVNWEDYLDTEAGLTLYVAADTNGTVAELMYWTGLIRSS